MNRVSVLSVIVVFAGISILIATTAQSQVGPPKNYVNLQPTTPGTSQSGHINVSGTIRSSQLVGGGAGVTGVNAAMLNGLNSTQFLQGIPMPLTLTGSISGSYIIKGENASTAVQSMGVGGFSTATSGEVYGVYGVNQSNDGAGVKGVASALSGEAIGVYGTGSSPTGVGVFGEAIATTGINYGGFFRSASPAGSGVYGANSSASGDAYGGYFETASLTGRAVYGENLATTGINYGG